MSGDEKKFPINANCTECGHSGQIFVSDEVLAKDLEKHLKGRAFALWRPLVVRRMVASWLIVALIGFAVGVLVARL